MSLTLKRTCHSRLSAFLLLFASLLLSPHFAAAQDAKRDSDRSEEFSPTSSSANNMNNHRPVPLTTDQRNQLVKIETAILNSADPKDTLLQVAQLNQVHPEQLLTLIEQNRRELDGFGAPASKEPTTQVPPGVGGTSVTADSGRNVNIPPHFFNVWKALSSFGLLLTHTVSKHPRIFTLIGLSVLLTLFLLFSAERTGLVLSSQRGWLSRGPTTLWDPPTYYLQKRLDRPESSKLYGVSIKSKTIWKDVLPELDENEMDNDNDDRTVWLDRLDRSRHYRRDRPSQLQQAAFCQVSIAAREFQKELDYDKNETDVIENEESWQDTLNDVLELSLDHASELLTARLLTEFIEPPHSLRLVSREKGGRKHAMLVVNKMGDWNRFGLLPLQVMQITDDDELSLTLTTTHTGGHWDGQIHVGIEKVDDRLKVKVFLVVPRKGRRISKQVALRIVEGLSHSIAASIRTRTRQSLARRHQSSRFLSQAKERAHDRRKTRFEQELALENMAEDRRRKWQRDHPNAGNYRPSGDRLKSPLNAMY